MQRCTLYEWTVECIYYYVHVCIMKKHLTHDWFTCKFVVCWFMFLPSFLPSLPHLSFSAPTPLIRLPGSHTTRDSYSKSRFANDSDSDSSDSDIDLRDVNIPSASGSSSHLAAEMSARLRGELRHTRPELVHPLSWSVDGQRISQTNPVHGSNVSTCCQLFVSMLACLFSLLAFNLGHQFCILRRKRKQVQLST